MGVPRLWKGGKFPPPPKYFRQQEKGRKTWKMTRKKEKFPPPPKPKQERESSLFNKVNICKPEKCEKSQFPIEILIKISQNFLENFQNSLHFGPNTQNFEGRFLKFTCSMEIILQFLIILHFYTNFSRFSLKVFIQFLIVLLYLSFF